MCVSPFSVNWDCRMASWSMSAAGYPNQCTFPQQSGSPAQSSLFGQCQFTDVTQRELTLSDEVLKAATAGAGSLPVRNSVVQVGLEGLMATLLWKHKVLAVTGPLLAKQKGPT